MLAITPAYLYINIIDSNTRAMPIIPAIKVFLRASVPNDALTEFDEISVSFVGSDPEFIKSTSVETSSSVKLPSIITSDANPCDTVAADKHFEFVNDPQLFASSMYEFSPSINLSPLQAGQTIYLRYIRTLRL